MGELADDKRTTKNAEVDATLRAAARAMSFGDRLAAEGVVTVALDDSGNLIERRPGGTRTPLP
jgi:hypothetical protein